MRRYDSLISSDLNEIYFAQKIVNNLEKLASDLNPGIVNDLASARYEALKKYRHEPNIFCESLRIYSRVKNAINRFFIRTRHFIALTLLMAWPMCIASWQLPGCNANFEGNSNNAFYRSRATPPSTNSSQLTETIFLEGIHQ